MFEVGLLFLSKQWTVHWKTHHCHFTNPVGAANGEEITLCTFKGSYVQDAQLIYYLLYKVHALVNH